jgi:homoserine O-succinyltransferase/O-acetyltransferase
MPLVIDGGRVPTRWGARTRSHAAHPENGDGQTHCIKVALVNNMPDPALEDTEMQFFELLDTAAGDMAVRLQLFSLPEIPRTDRGRQHLAGFYFDFDNLQQTTFDGIIITGTEPRLPDLREEPYWRSLTGLLDWCESNTSSAILSCLATHVSVLHKDSVPRTPLPYKQFGVFASKKVCDHALTNGLADPQRFPHSRWNEVRAEALTPRGYSILMQSPEAGVDLFVKQKRKSLFVHFQGHPEYGGHTLLKEYRRDIRRYLNRERETYPSMPHGYFDTEATKILEEFRENALRHRDDELMTVFPEAAVIESLQNSWHHSATCVYRNWLQFLAANSPESSGYPAAAKIAHG